MPKETGVGTIAQKPEQVAPYMIKTWTADDGETYKAVDYGAMDFILINAIKELSQKLDDQLLEITALQKELEE